VHEKETKLTPSVENTTQEALQSPPQERSLLREFGSLGIKIAVIVAVMLLVFTFVYGLHYNAEPGMNPSIKDGDMVLYYRWDKNYRADDLLLVNFQGQKEVRRVVAGAGDTVDITKEGLIINGALQQEPEILQKTERYEEGVDFPITLKEHEVFVLGDAREQATDSRIYGAVNIDDVQGKVIALFRRRNL
jgi:signal peptidase I